MKFQLNCFLRFHETFQWKKFLAFKAKNFVQWNTSSKETASRVISSIVLIAYKEVIFKNVKRVL